MGSMHSVTVGKKKRKAERKKQQRRDKIEVAERLKRVIERGQGQVKVRFSFQKR